MTSKDLYRELGSIAPEMIEAAAPTGTKPKKTVWVKWVAVAACLALIVTGIMFDGRSPAPETPGNGDSIASYFVITAQAADGETMELNVSDSCFNSSGTGQGNIFGVDMPLFNFSVCPANLKNNEAIYERFEITVSYNGTVVDMEGNMDEHIMIAYQVPVQGVDAPWSYVVFGWFTEPTAVMVNILDKESGEIVETITLYVNYLPEKQGYDLKITSLITKPYEQKEIGKATAAD